MRAYLLALCLLVPLGASASDDACVRSEPKPVFHNGQPGIRAHHFARVSNHEARETLQLAAGDTLEILQGGCEYLVTTFRLSGSAILPDCASRQQAYAAAGQLLRQLSQLKDASCFDLLRAAQSLEAVRDTPFEEPMNVAGDGDGFLTAQVQVNAVRRGFIEVLVFRGPL